jgi:cellulose synthase/poly-beta-1,6-N-acetylglucosamine synthase-like glycosyltransferase
LRKTLIIFSYDDGSLLLNPLHSALESNVDEIFLLYGGNAPYSEIAQITDSRLLKILESERKGKSGALRSIIDDISGDIVFMVSGDVIFDPGIVSLCEGKFSQNVGAISVKVRPINTDRLTERAAEIMWNIHDFQLSLLSSIHKNVHGGEFVALRKEIIKDMPEVVNDDEYLCIKAAEMGREVLYIDDVEVRNFVPSNPFDLFQQRRRINYGHIEIMKMGSDPMVMDSLFFTDPGTFIDIFSKFLKSRRWRLVPLVLSMAIEILSVASARIDMIAKKDHRRWHIVKRSSFPEPKFEKGVNNISDKYKD